MMFRMELFHPAGPEAFPADLPRIEPLHYPRNEFPGHPETLHDPPREPGKIFRRLEPIPTARNLVCVASRNNFVSVRTAREGSHPREKCQKVSPDGHRNRVLWPPQRIARSPARRRK